MGELIFLRKKEREPAIIPLLENIGNVLESSGIKVDLGMIVLQIEAYLRSLQRKPSKNSIAIAREMFQNYSDEDIEAIVRVSTREQWGARPGYFQAIIDEYHARQKHSPA